MMFRFSFIFIISGQIFRGQKTSTFIFHILSFQPSIETVFVTVFHEYKQILIPVILEMVSEANGIVSPENMQAILKKDAIYNAVGLCAFDMYDEVSQTYW